MPFPGKGFLWAACGGGVLPFLRRWFLLWEEETTSAHQNKTNRLKVMIANTAIKSYRTIPSKKGSLPTGVLMRIGFRDIGKVSQYHGCCNNDHQDNDGPMHSRQKRVGCV